MKQSNNNNITFDIDGIERFYQVSTKHPVKIAHVYSLKGPLLKLSSSSSSKSSSQDSNTKPYNDHRLASCFQKVVNRHPRMRSKFNPDEPFKGYIGPHITFNEAIQLVEIITVPDISMLLSEDQENEYDWKSICEREIQSKGFDLFSSPLFYLILMVPSPTPLSQANYATADVASSSTSDRLKSENETPAKLILFSDHSVSDGVSGQIIINDLLTQLISSEEEEEEKKPLLEVLPLIPSIYSQQMNQVNGFVQIAESLLTKLVKPIILKEIAHFKSYLPTRDDFEDFKLPVGNLPTSSFEVARGTNENLENALKRCREEGVTLNAALLVAVTLAMAKTKSECTDLNPFDHHDKFRCKLDSNYDLRHRLKQPQSQQQHQHEKCNEDEHKNSSVGYFICSGDHQSLYRKGIDFKNEKFWDIARQLKKESESCWRGFMQRIPLIFGHENIHRASTTTTTTTTHQDLSCKKGILNDINFSNIGKFRFKKQYVHASNGNKIVVESFHVFCNLYYLGPSFVMFYSSVDSISYSLSHRLDADEMGKTLMKYVVGFSENIGSISASELMNDVYERTQMLNLN